MAAVQYSDGTWIYCSGTLISQTIFLTALIAATKAKPCGSPSTPPTKQVMTSIRARSGPILCTRSPQNDPHDIAVVVLDRPVKNIAPALSAQTGALSSCRPTRNSPPSATAPTS